MAFQWTYCDEYDPYEVGVYHFLIEATHNQCRHIKENTYKKLNGFVTL